MSIELVLMEKACKEVSLLAKKSHKEKDSHGSSYYSGKEQGLYDAIRICKKHGDDVLGVYSYKEMKIFLTHWSHVDSGEFGWIVECWKPKDDQFKPLTFEFEHLEKARKKYAQCIREHLRGDLEDVKSVEHGAFRRSQ